MESPNLPLRLRLAGVESGVLEFWSQEGPTWELEALEAEADERRSFDFGGARAQSYEAW